MISEVETRIAKRWREIADWFEHHRQDSAVPLYTSVDIRHSGFKACIVDTNIFPSGFNNLCQRCFVSGPDLFRRYITEKFGSLERILIVPESYTRNLPYFSNLARICQLLKKAGYQVVVGSISPRLPRDPYQLDLPSGEGLTIHQARRQGAELTAGELSPELIILNNDLSEGVPEILQGLETPLAPPLEMGWYRRRKSDHFAIHHRLMEEFCSVIDYDPWRLVPYTDKESGIDFKTKEGLERMAEKVEAMLDKIKERYRQYDIQEEPYVFIKNNAGTFGMAITTATRGEQVANLTHKERTKMQKGKGGVPVDEVIIQEGVPTRDLFGKCYVEPVIYLMGGQVVGGFLRENCRVSPRDNFNSLGMTFTRPCLHGLEEDEVTKRCQRVAQPDYFPMIYDILSRIAALAVGYEIKAIAGEVIP